MIGTRVGRRGAKGASISSSPVGAQARRRRLGPTARPADSITHAGQVGVARRRFVLATVVLGTVLADASSKAWASISLADDAVSVGPVGLRLVHNRGAAFGIGSFLPTQVVIAVTAAVAALVAVAAGTGRLRSSVTGGLIVGGAFANVVDRVSFGSVVDFIDVGAWPAFNLADVAVVAGAARLAFVSLR